MAQESVKAQAISLISHSKRHLQCQQQTSRAFQGRPSLHSRQCGTTQGKARHDRGAPPLSLRVPARPPGQKLARWREYRLHRQHFPPNRHMCRVHANPLRESRRESQLTRSLTRSSHGSSHGPQRLWLQRARSREQHSGGPHPPLSVGKTGTDEVCGRLLRVLWDAPTFVAAGSHGAANS